VAGKLTLEELGLYWMICLQIYSHGGAIDDDPAWLSRLFKSAHPRTVRAVLNSLQSSGKVVSNGAELTVMRCVKELSKASERISKNQSNGYQGGRPSNKNNELEKANGFEKQNPTRVATTNHQPPTTNHSKDANASCSDAFESWYAGYPQKVGKGQARKAFPAALRRAGSLDVLIAGRDRYIRTKPPTRDWCHPATWLNGDRWLDEPQLELTSHGQAEQTDAGNTQSISDELLRRARERQGKGGERLGGDPSGNAGPLLSAVSGR
jgi:uncharacterized protein YdaU (DUF1376 family)